MTEFGTLFIVSGVYLSLFDRFFGPAVIVLGACVMAASYFVGS